MALRDTNGDGHFEVKEKFGDEQHHRRRPAQRLSLRRHSHSVERYKMTPGQLKPSGEPEIVVADLPGVEREHGDKGIAFDGKGSLYVNVGAPSNACQPRDRQANVAGQDPCPLLEKHGGIWKFDENKLGQKQADGVRFATGMRQMPAITWHDGALYIVMNNRDQLDTLWPGTSPPRRTPSVPPSRCIASHKPDANFGWPYCFFDYRRRSCSLNPEYGGDGKKVGRCSAVFAADRELPRALGAGRCHVLHRLPIPGEI